MFSHMMVGSNDLDRSKTFYDATFAAFGGREGIVDPKGRLVYRHNGATFLVTSPINGEPAAPGNGTTIGFTMTSDQADNWWKAGQEAGGTAIEDPPGIREGGGMKLYLAYLRDPDGNKLCALQPL
jgi:catechol 2,3-dioxygenase-like lactoylglutathione lyase family enzyme